MIAIGILALILTAIFSTWTAILRSIQVGNNAAASVQRARIAIRTIDESLASARMFVKTTRFSQSLTNYDFIAVNGSEPLLSFVARLDKFFPRSGKFGDLDVRRVTFFLKEGTGSTHDLVLRQQPLLMDEDEDEKRRPLLLAKNVKELQFMFWDSRKNDWTDEWEQVGQLPRLVMVILKVADRVDSTRADEIITRMVSIPAIPVAETWQMPVPMGGPNRNPTNPPPQPPRPP